MGFDVLVSTDQPVGEKIRLSRSLCYGMMCYQSPDSEFRQLERRFQIDLSPLGKMRHADEPEEWQPIGPLQECVEQLREKLETPGWRTELQVIYSHADYFEGNDFPEEMQKLSDYLQKAGAAGVQNIRFWGM